MTSAEIPYIEDFPGAVLAGVGEMARVSVYDTDPNLGSVRRPINELINEVVDDMFTRHGIESTRDLERVCALAARITVGRLATSPGFTVELGGTLIDGDAREVIDVRIRPVEPVVRTADVTIQPQDS